MRTPGTRLVTCTADAPGRWRWTAPAGITSVRVLAEGAQGGDSPRGGRGGYGAALTGTLGTEPGRTYGLVVGGGGAPASGGGGGGGWYGGGGGAVSSGALPAGGGGGGSSYAAPGVRDVFTGPGRLGDGRIILTYVISK